MTVAFTRPPIYARGDVVVLPFPGSSLGMPVKRRPALILASVSYGSGADYLCALITSQAALDPTRITLTPADIQGGLLTMQSYLRPLYLYTAGEPMIYAKIGTLSQARLDEAVSVLRSRLDP